MFSLRCRYGLTALFAMVILYPASAAWGQWVENGIAVCDTIDYQNRPVVVSDCDGGAIVAWEDYRDGRLLIFGQRLDRCGRVIWPVNGVGLCTGGSIEQRMEGRPSVLEIASDGEGGAVLAWRDSRTGYDNVYTQRVDALGIPQWGDSGLAVCPSDHDQWSFYIASDGAGGAIVAWEEWSRLFAQRIDASGSPLWAAEGESLCPNTEYQLDPAMLPDGAGGAIVAWQDWRTGEAQIYAQRVSASGAIQWGPEGVPLCAAWGYEATGIQMVEDGVGGAIVSWLQRDYDIDPGVYAQRVDASGTVMWAAEGQPICVGTAYGIGIHPWSLRPEIASDGAGGALIAWKDIRDANVYCQRVKGSGDIQWTLNGEPVCTSAAVRGWHDITSDGAGGAIVTWTSPFSPDSEVFAQRVSKDGSLVWGGDGILLCTAAGEQERSSLVYDENHGAIIVWSDLRSGNSDVYAQRMSSQGEWGGNEPSIASVQDVPADQGGWARVYFSRSCLDDVDEASYPITGYYVFRRVDDAGFSATLLRNGQSLNGALAGCRMARQSGIQLPSFLEFLDAYLLNDRCYLKCEGAQISGQPPGIWEVVGNVPAHQENEYICLVPTLADSTSSLVYSVYCVSAETTTPSVYYFSVPDSGYSVDNLPPQMPGGLAGQYMGDTDLWMHWSLGPENDLSHWAVYRGSVPDFLADEVSRIGVTTDTSFVDGDFGFGGPYYYKVSAFDVHENESGHALLGPDDVTGVPGLSPSYVNALYQNVPNPFGSGTQIAFSLAKAGKASLKIFDVKGRLVRDLVDEERAPKRYVEVWDCRDSRGRLVGAGTYFYRLELPGWRAVRKMTLAK